MSHRTDPLPPLQGPSRIVRELRYHEASRQVLGMLGCVLFAFTANPAGWLAVAAAAPVLAGIGIRLWASGVITKNRQLATSGPYAHVRHPLYVGNILILAGFALASGNWWSAPLAFAFLAFYYPPAIEYEERKLETLFGADWDDYARGTHRLWPTFGKAQADDGAAWSLRKSLTVNLEPLIAAFLLGLYVYVLMNL